jgi:predicted nuclease of predicted toxin-antitoxin system
MKLKLDENLGRRAIELLTQAGHTVATVASEGLCSVADENLIEICRREDR